MKLIPMPSKLMLSVAFISLFLITLFCQKEHLVDVTQDDNLDRIIDSEFKRLQMPGVAWVAVKGDSIAHSGAKGYANIKEKKAFTLQTRMMAASISKTMAVTALMQLYERGLISLDEDINSYLPFQVRNPYFLNDKITVKMLLLHTSSISDDGYATFYFNLYLYGYVDFPESLMSFEKNYLSENGRYKTDANFSKNKPGSKYQYTNVGGALLACLVEHVGGTDYNTYCKTNIFQPLGMTRTTWFFSETPKDEMAIPYMDNNFKNPSNPFYSYPDYPRAHLITTVEDLSKFMRAYIMAGTFNNFKLLQPQTVDLILQEYLKNDRGEQQGLVFHSKQLGNYTLWGHGGGERGVSTAMNFDKADKTGYIVFVNHYPTYSETSEYALLLYAKNK
ncbi:MAG: beta-lactamase family protein [Chitinivibrionales bacterium]|nr:beta-lactamase family protein [Chitinivibrionales bacterium]